jgi:hypothetical protein
MALSILERLRAWRREREQRAAAEIAIERDADRAAREDIPPVDVSNPSRDFWERR